MTQKNNLSGYKHGRFLIERDPLGFLVLHDLEREMKHMITDDYEVRRLKDDARTAIDALNSIVNDLERNGCIHEQYLSEKAEKAYACCRFLKAEATAIITANTDDGK